MGKIERKERLLWLDVVRCVAIIGVIMCHVVGDVYGFTLQSMMTEDVISRSFAFLVLTIGRIGVPFFLLITGYLMLDRTYSDEAIGKFWKTKVFGLLFATECWIIVYNVFLSLYHGQAFSIRTMLAEMFFLKNSAMNHMWYMPMILGMYLLLPLVANALATIQMKTVLIPFGLLAMLFLGIPSVNIMCNCLGFSIGGTIISSGFSGGVYGIYIIGGYLIKRGLLKKVSSMILGGVSMGCVIAGVVVQLYSYSCHVGYNLFYSHIVLLVGGMCLFELISRLQSVPMTKTITELSKYSFAIYLVHNPVNLILQKLLLWLECKYAKVFVICVLTMAISWLVAYGIGKIPKIGKKIIYMR